jgi:hypothetical protein
MNGTADLFSSDIPEINGRCYRSPKLPGRSSRQERKEEGGATWHLWTGDFEWLTPQLPSRPIIALEPSRSKFNVK